MIDYTDSNYYPLGLDKITGILDDRLVDLSAWSDIELKDFADLAVRETELVELILDTYINFRGLGLSHREAIDDLCI